MTLDTLVGGARVAGMPVEFSLNGAGAISPASANTDANGQALATYTAPATGSNTTTIQSVLIVQNTHLTNSIAVAYQPAPPTNSSSGLPVVAGGDFHSFYVGADGILRGTGMNRYGQLGDVPVPPFFDPETFTFTCACRSNWTDIASSVQTVAAGDNFTLFVMTNGTLWAMGENLFGELGNGSTGSENFIPAQVATDVRTVAAGTVHSLFIKTDDTLWAMGNNGAGAFGNGQSGQAYATNTTPIQVASGVRSVSAGGFHSLFVKTNGTLWAMGDNTLGALGDGATQDRTLPVQVATGVRAVAAGSLAGNSSAGPTPVNFVAPPPAVNQ